MQEFTLKRVGYGWSILISQLYALMATAVVFFYCCVTDAPIVQEMSKSAIFGGLKVLFFLLSVYLGLSVLLLTPLIWVTALLNWLLGSPINAGRLGASAGFEVSRTQEDAKYQWLNALGPAWFVFLLPVLLLIMVAGVLAVASWFMRQAGISMG